MICDRQVPDVLVADCVCCLVISVFLLACTQDKKSPVEGAWKNVLFQVISTDSLGKTVTVDYKIDVVKMWSEKNFSFVGQWNQDSIIRDFYGGGTYKFITGYSLFGRNFCKSYIWSDQGQNFPIK